MTFLPKQLGIVLRALNNEHCSLDATNASTHGTFNQSVVASAGIGCAKHILPHLLCISWGFIIWQDNEHSRLSSS
jgi:hypothetical protein